MLNQELLKKKIREAEEGNDSFRINITYYQKVLESVDDLGEKQIEEYKKAIDKEGLAIVGNERFLKIMKPLIIPEA